MNLEEEGKIRKNFWIELSVLLIALLFAFIFGVGAIVAITLIGFFLIHFADVSGSKRSKFGYFLVLVSIILAIVELYFI